MKRITLAYESEISGWKEKLNTVTEKLEIAQIALLDAKGAHNDQLFDQSETFERERREARRKEEELRDRLDEVTREMDSLRLKVNHTQSIARTEKEHATEMGKLSQEVRTMERECTSKLAAWDANQRHKQDNDWVRMRGEVDIMRGELIKSGRRKRDLQRQVQNHQEQAKKDQEEIKELQAEIVEMKNISVMRLSPEWWLIRHALRLHWN